MSKKGSMTTADYLPYEDYKRLVQSLINEKRYWWACYCILSFSTGLRFSDVKRLTWDQIINQKKLMVKAKKTKKTHVITIGDNASENLTNLWKKMGKPDKSRFILEAANSDNAVSIQYVNRVLKTFIPKYQLDIENFSSHTFRKTFGRYVYEKSGCSEKALMYLNQIFKHRDFQTTLIYIGVRTDEVAEIFNDLEVV